MKGFFTQTACVLLEHPCSLDRLEEVLYPFQPEGRREANQSWHFSGPELVLPLSPEKNGSILVDVVSHPWPDDMGSPQTAPDLFAAWSMGYFGPFTYPGGLTRARQQCWHWEEGRSVAEKHRAFIRIRSTYALGAKDDDLVMPEDYDPLPELLRVTQIAASAARVEEALCYFNPNGETLQSADMVQESLEWLVSGGPPPLNLWSNVRLFNLEQMRGWSLMDSVGLGQVDVPDQEACFPGRKYEPSEVSGFLLNAGLYLMTNGPVIKNGDTMTGPGGKNWQATVMKAGLVAPPRETLRWFPADEKYPPALLRNDE